MYSPGSKFNSTFLSLTSKLSIYLLLSTLAKWKFISVFSNALSLSLVVSSESSMIVSKLQTISKPARPKSSQQQTQLRGDWTSVVSRELSFSPVRSFGRWYFLLRTATYWNQLVQYAVLAYFQSHTVYTINVEYFMEKAGVRYLRTRC